MSDRIFGGFGLLFALFYIWQASQVPDSFMVDAIGARTFPYILGGGMVLTCAAIMFKPDVEPHWPRARALLEVGAAVAALWIYSLILPELGFVLTTAVFTAFLTWRLGTSPVAFSALQSTLHCMFWRSQRWVALPRPIRPRRHSPR